MDIADLISLEETAVLTGMSVRSVQLKVKCGEMPPPLNFGGAVRFRESEILAWREGYKKWKHRPKPASATGAVISDNGATA
jgi:predicted DNA-binding transcriptional regulator AlpA